MGVWGAVGGGGRGQDRQTEEEGQQLRKAHLFRVKSKPDKLGHGVFRRESSFFTPWVRNCLQGCDTLPTGMSPLLLCKIMGPNKSLSTGRRIIIEDGR